MIYIAECDHLPHSCCIKKLSMDFWDFNLSQKYNVAIFYVGLLPVLTRQFYIQQGLLIKLVATNIFPDHLMITGVTLIISTIEYYADIVP